MLSVSACIQELQKMVKGHQVQRAAITDDVVVQFTGERPMTGLLEKLFPKMQINAKVK